jgi:hypothetical protein
MKQEIENYRPKGFIGKGDSYLSPTINNLEKHITTIETKYNYDTLKLNKNQKRILSLLLIEFAEDLHNDIGLWKSIENYNVQLFSTPLPLFIKNEDEITEIFDISRIKYFIYTIYFELEPELVFSPNHNDLNILAEGIVIFLRNSFTKIPKDSGIKKYLSQPNDYCWDFKRKLVWVGSNSYLFRNSCNRYALERNNGKLEIAIIDDFICQENTIWSGLGVIDILSKAINLPEQIQNDVKSWYERYIAYYQVLSIDNNILVLKNIINDIKYEVYFDIPYHPFKIDSIIFGGIIPYGKYWSWSGVQHDCGILKDKNTISKIKNDFIKKATRIVYRYDKQLLSKAKESIIIHYTDFITYFGNDLVFFEDGLTMAAEIQKKDKQKYEKLSKDELDRIMKKNDMKNPFPNMNLPQSILDSENGIAVFFNKDEGSEMMMCFNDVLNGFKKQGLDLTNEEKDIIREFITSDAISPNFIYRMIKDYGDKSINSAFLINSEGSNIEFLLHKYKGHFYRNKYPEISFNYE